MQTLAEIDFAALTRRPFHPSPAAWEDQVFYFLLVDRFSDGRETGYRDNAGDPVTTGTTPPLTAAEHGNAVRDETDAAAWREAGARFVGGTLRGATSKIGYLARLGVTATVTPYPLERADRALDDLAADRVHGAAVLRIGDLRP